jgi:uncharacterized membrane protein YhaH (DUF805 family)
MLRTARHDHLWAVVCGAGGVLANVLLVGFFALDRPWTGSPGSSVLGPASDVVEIVQFAAFVPVVVAVQRRLPGSGRPGVIGAGAAAAVAVLQLLLVAGLVPAVPQAIAVLAATVVLSLWLLAVGLAGHRTARLPRPVSRCALLLGPALPVAAVLAGAGLLTAEPVGPVLVVAGVGAGAAGWLALPVFPLLVATRLLREQVQPEEVP